MRELTSAELSFVSGGASAKPIPVPRVGTIYNTNTQREVVGLTKLYQGGKDVPENGPFQLELMPR
jgi:hypothetical protein